MRFKKLTPRVQLGLLCCALLTPCAVAEKALHAQGVLTCEFHNLAGFIKIDGLDQIEGFDTSIGRQAAETVHLSIKGEKILMRSLGAGKYRLLDLSMLRQTLSPDIYDIQIERLETASAKVISPTHDLSFTKIEWDIMGDLNACT